MIKIYKKCYPPDKLLFFSSLNKRKLYAWTKQYYSISARVKKKTNKHFFSILNFRSSYVHKLHPYPEGEKKARDFCLSSKYAFFCVFTNLHTAHSTQFIRYQPWKGKKNNKHFCTSSKDETYADTMQQQLLLHYLSFA